MIEKIRMFPSGGYDWVYQPDKGFWIPGEFDPNISGRKVDVEIADWLVQRFRGKQVRLAISTTFGRERDIAVMENDDEAAVVVSLRRFKDV